MNIHERIVYTLESTRSEENILLRKVSGKMKAKLKYFILAVLLMIFMLAGCAMPIDGTDSEDASYEEIVVTEEVGEAEELDEYEAVGMQVKEDGIYTSKEEVAAYIYEFGHLPDNFITKKEAKELGWVSKEGNLAEVAPGMSIGGDYFGNYEGLLPEEDGRDYYECDIDSDGGYRGAKRIVFSNDGLIYYTEDHYESFELLYGEE